MLQNFMIDAFAMERSHIKLRVVDSTSRPLGFQLWDMAMSNG